MNGYRQHDPLALMEQRIMYLESNVTTLTGIIDGLAKIVERVEKKAQAASQRLIFKGLRSNVCIACGLDTYSSDPRYPTMTKRPTLLKPKACSPEARLDVGSRWFLRTLCEVDGHHLHEECEHCGAKWISEFVAIRET